MNAYAKGYAAENELLHTLYSMGWAVIRAPRSGRVGIPSPDILAAKDGRLIVVECKSRSGAFKVEKEQLDQLDDWRLRARADPYIGWKIARKGWFFLKLDDVVANNGNVGKRFLDGRSLAINEL